MNGKTQPERELFPPCYYKECRGREMPPKPKSKTLILCTERQGEVIRPPSIFSQPLTPQSLTSHPLRSPRSLALFLSSSPSLSPNHLAPLGVGRSSAPSNPVVGASVTKHKESRPHWPTLSMSLSCCVTWSAHNHWRRVHTAIAGTSTNQCPRQSPLRSCHNG